MCKIKLFFQKLIPFVKRRGIKGLFDKLLGKLHLKKVKVPVLDLFHFVVDEQQVPFSQKDYAAHKDDAVILLNWIIPEMGKGSGGHLNIFRFISHLENMGFHSRIYLHLTPNYRDNKSVREFLQKYFPILDERVEA